MSASEPRYIKTAREFHRIWHAALALVVALGLMIWIGLFVTGIADLAGFSATSRFWIAWNVTVLAVVWTVLFLALRRRHRY